VHSDETSDAYTGETSLSPRDATAEGQLWAEERCLEHAMDTHPVSILRVSNLHGTPVEGGGGRGFLFDFVKQAQTGWIAVPGDGEGIKDLIHIRDLVNIISAVAKNPPPTREALAIGLGSTIPLRELAVPIAEAHGAEIQLWAASGDEQWGFVEVDILHHRLAWKPEVGIEDIIAEALGNVAENPC
jgi:nucleoside-diphosphate-sugar epimerase